MPPIEGNLLGLMMFVVGGAVAGVGSLVFKLPDALTMLFVGLTLIVMDFVIRLRARSKPGWAIKKELGGYLFFIPAWGFGIMVIILNLINVFWGSS